jgi:hypothetical protein
MQLSTSPISHRGTMSTFRIVRGGQSRKRGRLARDRVERELHGVVIDSTAHLAKVPDPSWYDLRRSKTKPLGPLLWFLDRAHAAGAPMRVLMEIPQWISWYIRDLYNADERDIERDAA